MAEKLVDLAIAAGDKNPESWLITRFGTVLIHSPDVAIYIGCGFPLLRFGVGMPPVFGREDIAPIPISFAERVRLWAALRRVERGQLKNRREKALASVRV